MAFRIGIDTGGTFTDVVALDEATGRVHTTKTPSTPADPSVGFMTGVRKIAERAGFALGEIDALSHGTTVATNALLAEEFSGLGLIVTRGFRELLEIARQSVPQGYGNSYFWVKPERIVPLHYVREVSERLNFRGDVLQPFDESEAEAAAAWFRQRGVNAIGVCFLHAYASDVHERRMRAVLSRVHPDAAVSLSSDVLPEYREYERAVTTLVDAFVKPRVAAYVARIQDRVRHEVGAATPFYVMKSNGGVVSAAEVARQPITTILSGPAAGALGAAMLASAAGFDQVLTLDGGGTSTDVSLIEQGVPHLTTEATVGRYPVKVPMLDVVTVGTGGGSIAWCSEEGRLRVGPLSAGAEPGPMCYGRGGQRPTTTDASLLLGRLPPHLLGGDIPLYPDLAASGLRELGASLGLDSVRVAEGILEIAAWSQANAIREMSVKRGRDVRDYVLVAFGGSGPLQAGRLVDLLSLRAALIPPDPGNVSAFGLLTVDLRTDYVRTSVQRDDQLDLTSMQALFATLEHEAVEALGREGFGPADMRLLRSADLRYDGQAWEVRVEVPAGPVDRALADIAVARFHAAHKRAYGYSYTPDPAAPTDGTAPRQRVEWVNLRVTGVGPIRRPVLSRSEPGNPDPGKALLGSRPVVFGGQSVETPVFDRARLESGARVSGAAIVQEFGSTTVVFPGQVARVDALSNLLIEADRGPGR